jgi:hypothetical protein
MLSGEFDGSDRDYFFQVVALRGCIVCLLRYFHEA